jgi:hypothetical protein
VENFLKSGSSFLDKRREYIKKTAAKAAKKERKTKRVCPLPLLICSRLHFSHRNKLLLPRKPRRLPKYGPNPIQYVPILKYSQETTSSGKRARSESMGPSDVESENQIDTDIDMDPNEDFLSTPAWCTSFSKLVKHIVQSCPDRFSENGQGRGKSHRAPDHTDAESIADAPVKKKAVGVSTFPVLPLLTDSRPVSTSRRRLARLVLL